MPVYVGFEARYRYGELLSHLGQHEAATQMFNDILKHAKRTAVTLDEEQEWVSAARKAIASL
jgi:hypothetical protein